LAFDGVVDFSERKKRNQVRQLVEKLPIPVAMWIQNAKRSVFPAPGDNQFSEVFSRVGSPTQVLYGPFAEMKYVSEATGSAYLPKLLGSYEHELLRVVNQILSTPYDLLVDFGAAEGYYAIEFAWKMPTLRVVKFDIDKRLRWLLKSLATLNNVSSRVDIRSEGDSRSLNDALSSGRRPLIICDCEGYEDALLKPDIATNLLKSDLLVEMHDHLAPGATPHMRERFSQTHNIQTIDITEHPPVELLHRLAPVDHPAAREGRVVPPQWVFMTVK